MLTVLTYFTTLVHLILCDALSEQAASKLKLFCNVSVLVNNSITEVNYKEHI